MTTHIDGLLKQYVLWPELKNDFQKNINFSQTKIKDFHEEVTSLTATREQIENQIVLFYLANEKVSKARLDSQDVLGVQELQDFQFYQQTLNDLSQKLITYITVCCIVEARHVISDTEYMTEQWSDFQQQDINEEDPLYDTNNLKHIIKSIRKKSYGHDFLFNTFSEYKDNFPEQRGFSKFLNFFVDIKTDAAEIIRKYSRSGERDAGYQQIVDTFMVNNIPDMTIEKTLSYLDLIFSHGEFEEDFGGEPWAMIARHGLDFVKGKINAEMFVDQAFSLEHNNGNMFNKDFLFHESSNFNLNYITEIQSDYGDTLEIPMTTLILNAQHLGMVKGLFSIQKTYDQLNKIEVEDLYKQCLPFIEKGLRKQYNMTTEDELETSLEDFKAHIDSIKFTCDSILDSLQYVYSFIHNSNARLLENCDNSPIDFKKLFYAVSCNMDKDDFNPVVDSTDSEAFGMFDLWNHLHNNVLKNQHAFNTEQPFSVSLYDIETLPIDKFDKNIIGGKAWSLANMHHLGLPVPKAKVFGTDCCASYHQHKNNFKMVIEDKMKAVVDYLSDADNNPVLCSIRSGAAVSMPGMMDTVLNVGIDDGNYDYFCEKMGKSVVDNCVAKFMELFCSSRLNIDQKFHSNLETNLVGFRKILQQHGIEINQHTNFPLNKTDQIEQSLYAVFESWYSERAVAFRNEKNIDHNMGTAAIIQQMVFGNLNENSCTGVVFSRNCLTGENKLVGEFLPKAQGEDVVSGSVTPFDIEHLRGFNKEVYEQLNTIAKKLETQTGQIQDIEFTVENGKLYILQHRQAVCSPIAAVKLLEDKTLDHSTLMRQIEPKTLKKSLSVVTNEKPLVTGLSANSGVVCGIVIKNIEDMDKYKVIYERELAKNAQFGWIFYSKLTSPEHMPIMSKTHAFITEQGGFTSHAAIIARSLNKPCVVGLGNDSTNRFMSGDLITMDGTTGHVWQNIQPIVKNNVLAKSATKFLINKHNIDLKEVDENVFQETLDNINNKNRSWLFNFPEAKFINKKPLKKEIFLSLGQKIAMILAADQRTTNKVRVSM